MTEEAIKLPKEPNAFSAMHRGVDSSQSQLRWRQANFETESVRYVLQRLKLASYGRELRQLRCNETGAEELRFETFNNFFPTFPFILLTNTLEQLPVPWPSSAEGGERRTATDYGVHSDPYSLEPARFKKFHWVPFVVAYQAAYPEAKALAGESRRIGLVFPRRGFTRGMVIHDDETEEFWSAGLCWVYKSPNTGKKLYVQQFSALIEGIYANGRGWKPL